MHQEPIYVCERGHRIVYALWHGRRAAFVPVRVYSLRHDLRDGLRYAITQTVFHRPHFEICPSRRFHRLRTAHRRTTAVAVRDGGEKRNDNPTTR